MIKSQREIEETLCTGMTVADLIERLQDCDPDATVLFVCDYGDYHHTTQALLVEDIEERTARSLVDSAYSRSGLALVDADEDAEYFCQTCEEEFTVARCPKCGTQCVNEDGTPAVDDDDDDDQMSVVILR